MLEAEDKSFITLNAAEGAGRSAWVLGLGASGRAAAQYLNDHGWRVHAFDTREAPAGLDAFCKAVPGCEMTLGGFMAFSNVHFYDYMIFQEAQQSADADENDIMFAVSQSGETEPVLNDVRHAKQHGQKIISFTRRSDSTLAQLSDLVFVVDGAKQTLAGSLPNPFFGHIILIFEELMARFFSQTQ